MNRRGFIVWVSAILTALALVSPSLGAGSPTEVRHFTVDETSVDQVTSDFCGFKVITRLQATLTTVTSFQERPTSTRLHDLLVGPAIFTLTNVATGQTVEARNTLTIGFTEIVTASSSRFVIRFAGLNYLVKSAAGTITSAGSVSLGLELQFDEDGVPISVDVFGHAATPSLLHFYPVLCVLLGAKDTDGDYLPDKEGIRTEKAFRTDPNNPDTDGDGYLDGIEVANETDPTRAASHPQNAIGDVDKDDDFLWDGGEVVAFGTDPTNPDTDGDGFLDGEEVFFGTDPTKARSHP